MDNRVSCIIRTFNEADFIGKLIQSLRSQKNSSEMEIIVVDSGSTDGTVEIVKKNRLKLVQIPKAEFNYSYSLNFGIKQSRGDIIVILSAHTLLCDDNWLQKMVSNFENDNVAGVYCRQVPWPHADLFEVMRIEKAFNKNSKIFRKETPYPYLAFSNAASCIRRSIWEKHHFVIMPAAEDREWAQWAMENGYTIVYEANTSVYHSHNDSRRKMAQRAIELEKAKDVQLNNRRNLLVTIKQAIGLAIRDLRVVFSQPCFKGKRTMYCLKSFGQAFWYVVDFSRWSR